MVAGSTLAQVMAWHLMWPRHYLNPMLTSHWWYSVAFQWEQFQSKCPSYFSVKWVWKLKLANELNITTDIAWGGGWFVDWEWQLCHHSSAHPSMVLFTNAKTPHLTHLPLDKMAVILQMIFSEAFAWTKSFIYGSWGYGMRCVSFYILLIKISLKFVPRGPIDKNSALVYIIAWRWIGHKPLSEPMLTWFTDTYMHH